VRRSYLLSSPAVPRRAPAIVAFAATVATAATAAIGAVLVTGASLGAQPPSHRADAPTLVAPAQAAQRPSPVSTVLRYAQPGDTVTVVGRASVGSGALHDRALYVALQDDSAGIWIYQRVPREGEPNVPTVREGDSLVATGTLHVYRGSLELFVSRVGRIASPPRAVRPDTTWPPDTLREGRLLRVRAIAGAQGFSEGGQWLRLHRETGTDSITLWVPSTHGDAPAVANVSEGDLLDVTGVATVYRDNADDPAVTQIVPRRAADMRTIGIPRRMYALLLKLALAALGVSGLVFVAARGLTRRHARALRETEARYRQLLALSPDAVIVHDGDTVLFANPAAARLLGAPDELALAGRPVASFVGAEEREALAAAGTMTKALRGPTLGRRIRTCFVTADGTTVDVEAATSGCRYHDRDAAVVVARDIGPQLRYERELRELALLDDLTGLHNRRGFFMFAEAELRRLRERGSSAVLVFADLDGLKEINDHHGHAAGDTALRAVARAMREVVGAQGLTARWSGDEFAALIPDVGPPDTSAELGLVSDATAADNFDQRLAAALVRTVPQSTPFRVSASVGARRLGPDASETLVAALAAADAGLYRRRGRTRTNTRG
jgi:diguanylate cyclase (GGDEF)-like protein/PAS domain S-box-containing protein